MRHLNCGKCLLKMLEERLHMKPKDKPLKKTVRALRKDLLPRLRKYEEYENQESSNI
ncbi:MAG: hypothetical protein ACQEXX_13460 [Bacillota bacterium]